jgi:hypothetical protein
MSTGLKIDVRSVEELAKWLKAREERVDDFSVPLTDLAIGMERDVREAFPSGGGIFGLSWPAHAESTDQRWGVHAFGDGPTGNLIGSIRRFVRKFVAGVEAPAPHAHLFESGHRGVETAQSAGGPVRIGPGGEAQPERPFLLITEERTQSGIDMVLDYVLGAGHYERAA